MASLRARGLLAGVALACLSPTARAEVSSSASRLGVDVTSTTQAGLHTNVAGYAELFERLNVLGRLGAFQSGVRIDTANFFADDDRGRQNRYTAEKVWLSWTSRALEITAGDSYVSFGRGMVLSLRKVDELGVDTTLRGAKVLLHGDRFGATLAVGYSNINNVDEASGKSQDDPQDLIAGARVERPLWLGGPKLGAHASAVLFRDALGLIAVDRYQDRYFQAGGTLEAPRLRDWLGVYVEVMSQTRDVHSSPSRPPSFAAYASASAYFGAFTVLFEGKAYGDIEPIKPRVTRPEFMALAYNSPPTAERLLQPIDNPQRNIEGARLRVNWQVTPTFVSYINYGAFHDREGYSDPTRVGVRKNGLIQDPYVGIEARSTDGRSSLLASLGWRSVFLVGTPTLVRKDVHLELDAAQSIGRAWSVMLHVLHNERRKNDSPLLDHHFREGTIGLGVRLSRHGGIGAGYDYTTDPSQPKHDYFNASVEWNPTAGSSVRLFIGGTRGGLRCSSGVCRVFPPFEGVKLGTTLRF